MIAIHAFLFSVTFYTWTTLMLVICLPILIFDRKITVRCQTFWANGVLWLMRLLVGITVDVRGREHLEATGAIIASKHQSAWDTLIWHVIVDDPAIVMKSELLWIPLYGWYSLKVGMIPINRIGGANALKAMIRSAQKAACRQQPIIIFPQGTRTAPRTREPYQSGVVALYRTLNLPVVPVALNSGLFWPRRSFKRNPGTIVVKFLPPIAPGLDRENFMTLLEEQIEMATDALESEAHHQSRNYSGRET
tara:strand:+ start:450 stop:1196 length:747 start_codon:yes stop_codon:yes gene_type:complete